MQNFTRNICLLYVASSGQTNFKDEEEEVAEEVA
jgi:hypothetical protein